VTKKQGAQAKVIKVRETKQEVFLHNKTMLPNN